MKNRILQETRTRFSLRDLRQTASFVLTLLFLVLPPVLAQTVYPSEPAPFPPVAAAVGIIVVFVVVLVIVTHVKKAG